MDASFPETYEEAANQDEDPGAFHEAVHEDTGLGQWERICPSAGDIFSPRTIQRQISSLKTEYRKIEPASSLLSAPSSPEPSPSSPESSSAAAFRDAPTSTDIPVDEFTSTEASSSRVKKRKAKDTHPKTSEPEKPRLEATPKKKADKSAM
ncbi:hypothetical protein FPSE_07727 [Fusarium pseudograminearum CS3096]|uniref:Uncharacterized protein n=1 Tax=Fusarium pseudograminearum (strain CS3096) TaxID=1028729 RepID=K3VDH6_FUSPC|nr:hypothetical protein FPSE_07727 [Fusarium pseudograminearum CS3096]EKJ72102.1 hypothetical protein FPSE_07727 [Fusarium pseudograminearum CS3096]